MTCTPKKLSYKRELWFESGGTSTDWQDKPDSRNNSKTELIVFPN